MNALICNKCLQIPYVDFLPGLMVKFSCCETTLVPHFYLEEKIKLRYSIKCSKISCQKKNGNIHYALKNLYCEDCLKDSKLKSKINNDINPNSFAMTCKNHFKKFTYYNSTNHLLYCEECDIPQNSVKLNNFKENLKPEIIKELKIKEKIINKYLKCIFNKILETYELFKSKTNPNIYFNIKNIKNFLEDYDLLSPVCSQCMKIYNIKLNENSLNNQNGDNNKIYEVVCKCSSEIYNSIEDIEKKFNSIICYNCDNMFDQKDMFYDIIFDKLFCEECLKDKKTVDYIRFNELCYYCGIHRFKLESFCKRCKALFCKKCKFINLHQIIKFKENNNSEQKFQIFNKIKWISKLKDAGLLNIGNYEGNCLKISAEEKNKEFNKIISTIEEKKKNSFENIIMKKENEINNIKYKIENSILYIKLYGTNIEVTNLKDKIVQMEFSLKNIIKELNSKNKIVQLLKIRNVFLHLISNIIRKNCNSFERLKEDFRLLYESYKFLKYQLKYKEKENLVKSKLESIFEKIEKLIKNIIKNHYFSFFKNKFKIEMENNNYKLDDCIINAYFDRNSNIKNNFDEAIESQIPKIPYHQKIQIFNNVFENDLKLIVDKAVFSTLKNYNKFLLNHNGFDQKTKSKIENHSNLIENIENNKIPEDYEKSSLKNNVNLIGKFYLDEFGYTNDKSLNIDTLKEIAICNIPEENNYEYLKIKSKKKEEFLADVKCKTVSDFNFLFKLINNIINKIGKIVHQNDELYNIYFTEIEDNLNISNYQLKKDIDNNLTLLCNENLYKNASSLSIKEYDYDAFMKFSLNFFERFKGKIKQLLGEKKEKEIIKEADELIKEMVGKSKYDFENDLLYCSNKINETIKFHEENKDLLQLFPLIKRDIEILIDSNNLNELDSNVIGFTIEEENKNAIVNVFIKNYFIIACLQKIVEKISNSLSNYENFLQTICDIKYKNLIFELYNNIKEDKIENIFFEERDNLIKLYENHIKKEKEKLEKLKLEKQKIGNKKILRIEKEIEENNLTIEKMKEINIKYIEKTFDNYLDFNVTSFANAKFDVTLFLYQNEYIN